MPTFILGALAVLRSNSLPRPHELLRDCSLNWSCPAVTSEGRLIRGLGLLFCWLGMASLASGLWPLADPASLAACTQRCQAAYDADAESCTDVGSGTDRERCLAIAEATYFECMGKGCGICVIPLPSAADRELTIAVATRVDVQARVSTWTGSDGKSVLRWGAM